MDTKNRIFVIESNDFAAEQIVAVLARFGLDDAVRVAPNHSEVADSAASSGVLMPAKPLRMGQVLDQIFSLQERKGGSDDVISLGSRRLDTHLGVFYDDAGGSVRLTEKEVEILVLLAAANGAAVSRDTLLGDVWKYAQDVETHTLETHIYRLRQKIEADPAQPQFLQTRDEGYCLSIE